MNECQKINRQIGHKFLSIKNESEAKIRDNVDQTQVLCGLSILVNFNQVYKYKNTIKNTNLTFKYRIHTT